MAVLRRSLSSQRGATAAAVTAGLHQFQREAVQHSTVLGSVIQHRKAWQSTAASKSTATGQHLPDDVK